MKKLLILLFLFLLSSQELIAKEKPIIFIDSAGEKISIKSRPSRVVSLVPSITEMLLQIGAGETVIGITHQDSWPAETAEKVVVGGFFQPDLNRVAALEPDLIFYSSIQDAVVQRFTDQATLINLSAATIDQSFEHLRLLGDIFDREENAEKIITEQQRQLTIIKQKTNRIPEDNRLRTVRLMAREKVMVPGDDSFQNDYITSAGGVAPHFGQNGAIIEPALDKWKEFNPQVIYGCGDRQELTILQQPGWGDVDAVKNNRIYFFPCDLTCRASTHSGDFVSLLAAKLYEDDFADPDQLLLPAEVVDRKAIDLNYEYVKNTEKIYSDILDFRHKTLLIELKEPMTILSTLDGWRQDVTYVGNHYFPPPSWGLGHGEGLEGLKKRTFSTLDLSENDTAMLFTGADMDNLAIATVRYKKMEVTALVTAGVEGNALRMAKDDGGYYELDKLDESLKKKKPGTINTILLTNTTLSKRAMTRALVSAVEAKSAALQDLDIRSTATPKINPATGTGTDNILIVQGKGPQIDATGGHTKMGELIARAVYKGVTEAIARQNGITAARSIFTRLKKRKISPWQLGRLCDCGDNTSVAIERLLLQPQYSNFIAAAFAISDQYERGLINDLDFFDNWCQVIAGQIAGSEVHLTELEDLDQPLVIRKALGALTSGLRGLQ